MNRYLVVSADDVGMCRTVNMASMAAHKNGIVRSFSLMPPAPAYNHAVKLLKSNGIRDVGVHLTLTSEFSGWRWGPLSPIKGSRSLRRPDGTFWETIEDVARSAKSSEIYSELSRQVSRVLKSGLTPTHLDSHMFALHPSTTKRADLCQIVARLCHKFQLPFRSPFPKETKYYSSRDIPVLRHCRTDTYDIPDHRKHTEYRRIIRQTPKGITELVLHCGFDNKELKSVTAKSCLRQIDYEFAVKPTSQKLIESERIGLISWKEAAKLLRRQ